jgi:hypothetical protein
MKGLKLYTYTIANGYLSSFLVDETRIDPHDQNGWIDTTGHTGFVV